MTRRYFILDVFTKSALAGNQLAVVLDSDGLDDSRMQAIATEFNLSETVFVQQPSKKQHRAQLRIFTPSRELPFAGHPTIGTAVLLGVLDQAGSPGSVNFGLQEQVGVVPCVVEIKSFDGGQARFSLPVLPSFVNRSRAAADIACVLGLDSSDIGFDRHVLSRHDAGVGFDFVPVATLDALFRANPHCEAVEKVFGPKPPSLYVYTRAKDGRNFRARMFGLDLGVREDPATGSAAAAFAGVLVQYETLGDGEHAFEIGQGYEMGRPSQIGLRIAVKDDALTSAQIIGDAVIVAEGTLRL